jgi:FKBP-type peptidyl-prolyl cis-trans isomerase
MRFASSTATSTLALALLGAVYTATAASAEPAEPSAAGLDFADETTRINYSLGYQIGGDFKRQGVEMDADAVVQGIADALADAEPKMAPAEMQTTLRELKRKVVAEQRKRSVERELDILAAGEAYMKENAGKPGVQTTESGLQYEILESGTGKSPGPQDEVTVHYRGTLIDGKEFDSSHKRGEPASFRLDGVIKGWSEGLQLMHEGDKARFVIPPKLAYGDRGPLGHRTLIFDVELLSVTPPAAAAAEAAAGE